MSATRDSASLPYVPFQPKPRVYEKSSPPDFTDYITPGYSGYIPGGRDFESLPFTAKIRAAKAASPGKSPKSGADAGDALASPASPSAAAAASSPKSPKSPQAFTYPQVDKRSPIPGYSGHIPQHVEAFGGTFGNSVREAFRAAEEGSKSPSKSQPVAFKFDKRHCPVPPHAVAHQAPPVQDPKSYLPSGYTGHLHGTFQQFGRPFPEIAKECKMQYEAGAGKPSLQPGASGTFGSKSSGSQDAE
eukprot:tig00001374_g8503.t1